MFSDDSSNILVAVTTYSSGDSTADDVKTVIDDLFSRCYFKFIYNSQNIYTDGCSGNSHWIPTTVSIVTKSQESDSQIVSNNAIGVYTFLCVAE